MLVDHLIYAVPDLTAAVADFEDRFGVRAQAGAAIPDWVLTTRCSRSAPARTWRSSRPTPGSPSPPTGDPSR
jgi:hypothetical protein